MRLSWIWVNPESKDWLPCEKRDVWTQKCRDEATWRQAETGVVWLWAQECRDCWQLQKLGGHPATDSPWEWANLLTPWPQISRLQNCERINFCCSKPPSLWSFVSGSPKKLIYPLWGVFSDRHLCDLNSLIRGQTCGPCSGSAES